VPDSLVATSTGAIEIPETASQAHEEEARGVYWLLAIGGLALVIPAWLLPWFVAETANGIGFSPQDVVSSSPTGIGTVLVYVIGICMLALLAGVLYDAGCVALGNREPLPDLPRRAGLAVLSIAGSAVLAILIGGNLVSFGLGLVAMGLVFSLIHDAGTLIFKDRTPFQYMTARGYLALIATVTTVVVWVLIGVYREESLFGPLKDSALTDNAVWMMLTGMGILTLAHMEGRRLMLLLGDAVATGLALTGMTVTWFHTDAILPSKRQGHSLLDALGEFHGISTVLLYVVFVTLASVAAGFALDLVRSGMQRRVVLSYGRERGIIALVGAAAALLVTVIEVKSRGDTFGSGFATLDERFGFVLAGLLVCAMVCLIGERLVVNKSVALGVVAFVVGGLFPLIFTQSDGFISWGASFASIYVLLALGLNVVVGFAGLLDLGYAAFFAIGAYTAASLNSPRHGLFLPFWVILFLGAAVAALFGGILGAPTLRLRGDYLAIVTLGFGEIVPDMAKNNLFQQTGGPNGITGIHAPSIDGYSFGLDSKPFYWALIIIVALVMLALRNIEHSRLGRAWMAIREDEIAAAATGINTVSTKLLAFAIGASISGLAGAFYGAYLGIVTPGDFDFAVSVTALSTVVLGGIGNNAGAATGGVLISFIIFWILPHMQEWAQTFGHTTGITTLSTVDYSNYKYITYGIILMSVMLLRPGGLLPSKARRIELQTGAESEPLAAVQGVV
jgi:branched-chain amino acid transport system permease protein